MPPASPPARTVEPVACQHIEFVDQNDLVVKPPQRSFWNGADQARPGRFDSERKASCGPDSSRNARGWLRLQGIKRGSKVPGRYDRPGRPRDFGQPLCDIHRFCGCQRQIPGRSVPGNEWQHLSDFGGDLARQAATPCREVGQAHTEGIDDATGALHSDESSRGRVPTWDRPR